MRKTALLSSILLLSATALIAADAKKPLSPPAKASGTIGAAELTVDYSAPSVRGRKVMGGLVPYGQVWRTGANAATTLTTSRDVMIGNLHVPAGTYTLYTIPAEKEWTLIVNKQTGQWGTKYDQAQDLGRVKMKVESLPEAVETMAFAVDKKGLSISWENTRASVPVMAH